MMAVPVMDTGAGFEFGKPATLFQARLQVAAIAGFSYDATRGGKNFVLVTESEGPSSNKINVLVNWTAGLRR